MPAKIVRRRGQFEKQTGKKTNEFGQKTKLGNVRIP
jgi:hypothetical protein